MKQILIALDQLANTLASGHADETLSARAWRLQGESRRWAWARRLIDALFFWERDHCQQSWQSEMDRKHLPHQYR